MNGDSPPARTTKMIQTPPEMMKELTNTFRHGPYQRLGNTGFVIACSTLVLIALIVLAMRIRRWRKDRRRRPRPRWLFVQALRRLGLGASDRWLLWRMACHHTPASPTAILLSPRLLALAARSYQTRCGHPSLREAVARRAESICRLLFDEPLPAVEDSPPEAYQYSST